MVKSLSKDLVMKLLRILQKAKSDNLPVHVCNTEAPIKLTALSALLTSSCQWILQRRPLNADKTNFLS